MSESSINYPFPFTLCVPPMFPLYGNHTFLPFLLTQQVSAASSPAFVPLFPRTSWVISFLFFLISFFSRFCQKYFLLAQTHLQSSIIHIPRLSIVSLQSSAEAYYGAVISAWNRRCSDQSWHQAPAVSVGQSMTLSVVSKWQCTSALWLAKKMQLRCN